MAEQIITVDDIRKAGHCPKGIKRWCDQNGIDFRLFRKQGIPASELREKCGLAARIVDKVIATRSTNNG